MARVEVEVDPSKLSRRLKSKILLYFHLMFSAAIVIDETFK